MTRCKHFVSLQTLPLVVSCVRQAQEEMQLEQSCSQYISFFLCSKLNSSDFPTLDVLNIFVLPTLIRDNGSEGRQGDKSQLSRQRGKDHIRGSLRIAVFIPLIDFVNAPP